MDLSENQRKLRELILYVSKLSAGDSSFESLKMKKLLFFIDFHAYANLGRSITGQEYVKRPQGPCPQRLMFTQEQLISLDALAIQETSYLGHAQRRPVCKRAPNLTLFTQEEKSLIERVVTEWWGVLDTDISATSRSFVDWGLAQDGESIPYETSLLQVLEPTPEEVEWARELESRRPARQAS